MKAETRRVYLFIVAGLLAAAAVGYGVWQASTPTTPSASDIATQTPEVATISKQTELPQVTTPSDDPEMSTEAAAQAPTPPLADDPFLAPHAIVQAVPSSIAPTTVYRPENVRPTTAAEPAPAEPTTSPTDETAPDDTDTGTTEAPTQPGEPTEPTVPAEPGETLTPDAPDGEDPDNPGAATITPEPTEPAEPEPSVPAEPTETGRQTGPTEDAPPVQQPDVQQATVTQDRSDWWNPARWFPFSS